jgi:UDP-2,3-diacylglucosamine hydrolase
LNLVLKPGKKLYFASDFHLGVPNYEKSLEREKKIVRWLDSIAHDAQVVFLLGDLFDFWFEYPHTVPKGYVRFLGKLAELTDRGIEIIAFKGNHDMWMFGYFKKELNIPVISDEYTFSVNNKRFFLHHGDGLGPGDKGYKILKSFFRNPLCIWAFKVLPPSIGMGLANFFSSRSRLANGENDEVFLGEDEYLIQYSREKIKDELFDYLIFGHRHLSLEIPLNDKATYINLGEWITQFTYAEFDGTKLELKKYND